jgi:hypothetical protein
VLTDQLGGEIHESAVSTAKENGVVPPLQNALGDSAAIELGAGDVQVVCRNNVRQ